jgi:hypothetical protein
VPAFALLCSFLFIPFSYALKIAKMKKNTKKLKINNFMTEKRYVFIPETSKYIRVFNTKNESLASYSNLNDTKPDVMFKYCIDEFDKIKLFYIDGKSEEGAVDDFTYINAKVKDTIRGIFSINELAEFNLILEDDNPRVEFTIFYDISGNFCSKYKLEEYNSNRTILAHTYIYNIYKRYNLQ